MIYEVWVNESERIPQGAREFRTTLDFRRLTRAELEKASDDPENQLSRAEIDSGLAEGGECWAFVDGERIANRRWYVTSPVAIDEDLRLHFGADWILGRQEFTHPDYRGQRLLLLGGVKGTDLQTARGRKGIFGLVWVANWASRRASARVGSRYLGRLVLVGRGRFLRAFLSRGCRELDLRTECTTAGRGLVRVG